MLKLEINNAHERDKRIKFYEEQHFYEVDNVRVGISATGFIGHFHAHFDSDKAIQEGFEGWKKNSGCKYFYLLMHLTNEGKTDDEMKTIIKNLWNQNGRSSSSYGTSMHKAIELYLNDIEQESYDPEFPAFVAWRATHPTWEPYRTEWSVFMEEYDIAGQIDSVWIDTADMTYHIVDWKITKTMEDMEVFRKKRFKEYMFSPFETLPDTNWGHYVTQQSLYQYILEQKYGLQISSTRLAHFKPVTTPSEVPQYREYCLPNIQDKIAEALRIYQVDCALASMDVDIVPEPVKEVVAGHAEEKEIKNDEWEMDIPDN